VDSAKASSIERSVTSEDERTDRRLESSAGTPRRLADKVQRPRRRRANVASNVGPTGPDCVGQLSSARVRPQRPRAKTFRGFRHDRRQNDQPGQFFAEFSGATIFGRTTRGRVRPARM